MSPSNERSATLSGEPFGMIFVFFGMEETVSNTAPVARSLLTDLQLVHVNVCGKSFG